MNEKRGLTKKQQKTLAWIAIAVLVVVVAAICIFVGWPMVRFAADPEKFRAWVDKFGFGGKLIYMGMVFLQVVIAIIPGEPIEIVGGYAFGAVEGTIIYLIAATLGSILVFLLVRRFGEKLAEIFFPVKKLRSLRFLHTSPKRVVLYLLIFMIPGTPKDLLCYVAGLTDIKFGAWLLICSLGRIPSLITSTVGGDALGSESYIFAVIVFAATFLISGAGLLIYNHICKRNEVREDADH